MIRYLGMGVIFRDKLDVGWLLFRCWVGYSNSLLFQSEYYRNGLFSIFGILGRICGI